MTPWSNAFENHTGDCLFSCVRKGQGNVLHAYAQGELGGLAVESNRRTASGLPVNLDVAPTNATAPAGAQRFHGCFFGGETGGISLDPVGLRFAIANFFFRINSPKKSIAEPGDGFSDAW